MQATQEKHTETNKEREKFVIGLILSQRIILDEVLSEAKLRYADIALKDESWHEKNDQKIRCRMIEAQIMILNKLERDCMAMFSMETN